MSRGTIFTSGYGNKTLDNFLDELKKEKISYVIDVRSSPYSRFKPDFSRDLFVNALEQTRMKYVFMGDLLGGRPRSADCYTDGKVDYTKTRKMDFFVRGIERLRNAYRQNLNVCLMCSEAHPGRCHRSKLIAEALSEINIDVTHIMPDGTLCDHKEVILNVTDGQSSLFGEHFVSRKNYR